MNCDTTENYESAGNEELVRLARNGDGKALSVLCRRFLYTRGSGVSVSYLDSDDFVQESMFGFLRAVETFDFSKGVPFEAYAFRCMQNSINSVAGASKKDVPFADVEENYEPTDFDEDPLSKVLQSENLKEVIDSCETVLSDTEKSALFLRAGGASYTEISEKLKISVKSVENALLRARKKLKEINKSS